MYMYMVYTYMYSNDSSYVYLSQLAGHVVPSPHRAVVVPHNLQVELPGNHIYELVLF